MTEIDIPNWLNSSFFETALRSGGYGPNVTVISSEIGRATGAGDNYVADIYRAKLQVTLDGHRSTLSLIVKSQREKTEIAKVNILFCFMLHIRAIRIILNRNTLSIFLLHIYHMHIRIYVLQICRSLCELIIICKQYNYQLHEIMKRKIGKIIFSALYGININLNFSNALNKKFSLTCVY